MIIKHVINYKNDGVGMPRVRIRFICSGHGFKSRFWSMRNRLIREYLFVRF